VGAQDIGPFQGLLGGRGSILSRRLQALYGRRSNNHTRAGTRHSRIAHRQPVQRRPRQVPSGAGPRSARWANGSSRPPRQDLAAARTRDADDQTSVANKTRGGQPRGGEAILAWPTNALNDRNALRPARDCLQGVRSGLVEHKLDLTSPLSAPLVGTPQKPRQHCRPGAARHRRRPPRSCDGWVGRARPYANGRSVRGPSGRRAAFSTLPGGKEKKKNSWPRRADWH